MSTTFSNGLYSKIGPTAPLYTTSTATDAFGNITIQNLIGVIVGMPIAFSYKPITTTATATSSTNNAVTVTTTSGLYTGMPVIFSGTTFGGIMAGTTYYVLTVIDSYNFTISSTMGGPIFALTTATGSMSLTAGGMFGGLLANTTYYITSINTINNTITVSTTLGGTPITTTAAIGYMNVLITGATSIVTSASNARVTVVGLNLSNLTSNLAQATVYLVDGNNNNNSVNYIYNVNIPPNQSLKIVNGGERLVLNSNTTVNVTATLAASVDCVVSYVIIQ